jgi:hypothetical protein
MRFLLLIASILWAGWQGRNYPRMLAYFFAQYLYTVTLEVILLSVGMGSLYTWAYAVMAAFTLGAGAWLVWEGLESRPYRLRPIVVSFLLALTPGHMAYINLPHPARLGDWVTLLEGIGYVWIGTLMAFLASRVARWGLALVLGFLWLSLGLFDLGYFMLDEKWPTWVNWYIPSGLCFVAFTFIGWRLKKLYAVTC